MNSHTTFSPLHVPPGWANAAWYFAELRHRTDITTDDWGVIVDWLKTTHFDADSCLARDVAVSLIQDRAPAAIVHQIRDLQEAAGSASVSTAGVAAKAGPRASAAKSPAGLPSSVRVKAGFPHRLGTSMSDRSTAVKVLERIETSWGTSTRQRKLSGYGLALVEKQKLKYYYGLREAQLRRYFVSAKASAGNIGERLIVMCERRLDNVIRRAGFTTSRVQARQGIVHRHFQLNGETVDRPAILVQPGDVITVRPRSNLTQMYRKIMESAATEPVDWIRCDAIKLAARILALPTLHQVASPINMDVVVAFLSR